MPFYPDGTRILCANFAGKSLFAFKCQPLLLPGVTLVISATYFLMQDQVSNLEAMGIPAVLINSGQSLEKNRLAIVL